MKISYVKGSIAGTILSTSFQKGFTVVIEDVVENVSDGKGVLHPILETPNDDVKGYPQIEIKLPTLDHPACEIEIGVSIPTQTLGVFDVRKIKKGEIKALRDHWAKIRQSVMEDAYADGEDLEPLFDKIDPVMTSQKVRIYTPNPDLSTMRLALVGTAPAQTTKPVAKPTHVSSESDRRVYAVNFAYSQRGEYCDDAPSLLSMTKEEVDLLTETVVHDVDDQEDLDALNGKFYTAAELLKRVKERPRVSPPTQIEDAILIWIQ